MKSIQITINLKTILYLVISIVVLYFFFAFLPIPQPIDTGLDPSWKYGISQVAEDGAIFGKEIIFTYGAFGYLVRGAAIVGNFWDIFYFKIFVHLVLFGFTIFRIFKSRNFIEAIAVGLSVGFPYLISDFYQALQTEYQLLYIIILILSFREFWQGKSAQYWAIGVGAVGGFLLHTKVSLGLQASVSLFLFFAVRVLWGLRTKRGIRENLLLLLDSQLAAATTAFVFLAPQNLGNFGKTAIFLAASMVLGFWVIPKLFNSSHLKVSKDPQTEETQNQNWTVAQKERDRTEFLANLSHFGTRIIYGLSLLILISFSEPSLFAYIEGYSNITSGYSSSMSYVGSPLELGFALVEILGLLWLFVLVARDGNASFSTAMLLVVLLTFKHGFVRQGAHVIRFFFSMPLILSLCAIQIRPGFWRKFAYGFHLYALLLCVVTYNHYSELYSDYYPQNLARPLTPKLVKEKAGYFFKPQNLQNELIAESADNLDGVRLPPEIRDVLGDRTIDIIPWETSLVPANRLNWKPRPIFQSQVAYRPYLDFANRDDLAENPRDFLLYNFHAVDGQHPFFTVPATAFHYTCNYQVSQRVPAFVDLPKLPRTMVLEPLSESRCVGERDGREIAVVWEDTAIIEAGDGDIVRASVKAEYSMLGKLAKTFFRVPPVWITVLDMDGEEREYKILTDNSEDGVWLSHLPKNDAEAFELLQGQLPQRIYGFKFSTRYPSLFAPRIQVKLIGYDLGGFRVKK
ncbi:putative TRANSMEMBRANE PROTEIN [Geitlerinema sp. FC II]|nr:putative TRANSMEMBRANE PROTEIN [Geitlerinema sp. FC II]